MYIVWLWIYKARSAVLGLVITQFLTTIKLTPFLSCCMSIVYWSSYNLLYHTFCCSLCAGKVANITQVFPETNQYRCHCPSTILKCTFPESSITAAWYVLVNGVLQNCNGYPNHSVDSTDVEMGTLVLSVNDTSLSQINIYSCAAVYGDGSSAQSMPFMLPRYGGQL